jgi:superfamily II DNA or RNA helicase
MPADLQVVNGEDPTILVPLEPGQTPLRWQREAMLSIRKYLPEHGDILVSAATGTGKGTLIASLAVKAFRAGKRTLFLVHRDELIEDVMARALAIDPRLSAGKVKGDQNEWAALCVFASVQTLQKHRLADIGRFDFIFTDEAHHATAKTYLNIYKRVREVNPRAKHIGFTATPFRSGKDGKTTGIGDVFRLLCYEYSLQDAINDGVLCPIICMQIETHLDLTDVDPDDEEKLEKLVDTPDRNAVAVAKYLEHRPGKQAIFFGVSIQHAKNLAAAFKAQGISAEPVWGTDRARAKKIAAFKAGTLTVLCNKDLLTEGFDHRPVEVVGLVRPTNSRGLFAQMIGRATRRSPATDKETGLVLDFVANSSTHDLVSTSNLAAKEEHQRIEIGDEVRHKRVAALSKGTVDALSPSGKWANVIWANLGDRSDEFDGGYPCDLLVLTVAARTASTFEMVPTVAGVSQFEVMLFGNGARQVAWYTYDSSSLGKIKVARGERMSCLVLRKDGRWEAWVTRHVQVENPQLPLLPSGTYQKVWQESCERIAYGDYGAVFSRACTAVENPQPYDLDWQKDPATPRQVEVLKKFQLRREHLSKGEASMLLEIKIGLLRVDRARKAMPPEAPAPQAVPV